MRFYSYRTLLKHFKGHCTKFPLIKFPVSFNYCPCFYVATGFCSAADSNVQFVKHTQICGKFPQGKDVRESGDSDVFGSLTKELKVQKRIESMAEEEDDIVKYYVHGKVGKCRLSSKEYADLIKKYITEKKLMEACQVLEVRMLKEDGVKPDNYIYNLLIDACAKFGFAKKAFHLYNEMKKRDLKVTGATYTSLFNACALSSVPGDGLKKAFHLKELLIEKRVDLNHSNYHAMIKAFGHCGDIVTAFGVVDEMLTKGITLKPETFVFLLQACISDKENGFMHALMVWRKMREKGVKPSIYCYNMILRCARDCNIVHLSEDLKLLFPKVTKAKFDEEVHRRVALPLNNICKNNNLSVVSSESLPSIPNLLATTPQIGSVVFIKDISKPKHRLMLLGGWKVVLKQMVEECVKPDVKTATLLLNLIPSTTRDEYELIKHFEESKTPLDTDFFNMLMKKRCMRHDYLASKAVLNLLSEWRLEPNIMTFGILSLSCRNSEDSKQFLQDLKDAGFRVNIEILGGLLCSARHTWNIEMVLYIMDIVLKEEIKASKIFVNHLDKIIESTTKQIQLKKQGLPYHHKVDEESFLKSYSRFLIKYRMWLKFVDVNSEGNFHPWKQFTNQKEMTSSHGTSIIQH